MLVVWCVWCVMDGCCSLVFFLSLPVAVCFVGMCCLLLAVRNWLMSFGDCRVLFRFMFDVCVVCALLVVACCSLCVV